MIVHLLSFVHGITDTGPAAIGYRPLNGTGNNIANPSFGALLTPYSRFHSVAGYSDGISSLPLSRPNAKLVSNTIFGAEASIPNSNPISDFLTYWGQLISHDIALTNGNSSDIFPYTISSCDLVDPGVSCGDNIQFNFTRAQKELRILGDFSPVNFQTSFLDASVVYGANLQQNSLLRVYDKGLMKSWIHPVSGAELLPLADSNTFSIMDSALVTPDTKIFLAGDARANVSPVIITLQTLLLREHNRKAREIYQNDSSIPDELIFQRARAWVVALMQKITYTQYLPLLLGSPLPTYSGYNPNVDASAAVDFVGMAFRYGHSAISSQILRLDENGVEIPQGSLLLRDHFFKTDSILSTNGDIESILRGLVSHRDQEVDSLIVDDLRKHFVAQPYDLATMNILRGRDFGIPTYNILRETNGLSLATSWSDITSNSKVQARLASVYDSIDNLDPWVGGLCEDKDPYSQSQLGPLFTTVIQNQFIALRDGDRFWYERAGVLTTQEQIDIQSWSLSTVVLKNTNITYFPSDPFALYSGPFVQSKSVSTDSSQIYIATSDYTIKWVTGTSTITYTLCGNFKGWMAIGFNMQSASMAGSEYVIAIPDQVTGKFSVAPYSATGDLGLPVLSTAYQIDSSTVVDARSSCGTTQGVTFQRPLVPGGSGQSLTSNSSIYFLFAYGPDMYTLSSPHGITNRGGKLANFFSTTSSTLSDLGALDTLVGLEINLVAMHGIVLFTCFTIIFPAGIFIIRYMKLNKNSLSLHKSFMSFGVYTAEITMLALTLGARNKLGLLHVKLGVAMFIMFTVTAFIGNQATRLKTLKNVSRRYIKLGHRIIGSCSMALGYVTAAFGVIDISSYGQGLEGRLIYAYIASVGMVIALFFILGETGVFIRWKGNKSVQPTTQSRGYYWSEIIQRIENGESWLIIGSSVYDVAEFGVKHPGGRAILEESIGTDATRAFFGSLSPLPRAIEYQPLEEEAEQCAMTNKPLANTIRNRGATNQGSKKAKVPNYLVPAHSAFAIQQLHSMFVGRILDYQSSFDKEFLKKLPNELTQSSTNQSRKAISVVSGISSAVEERRYFISKFLSEMEINTTEANRGIFSTHYINMRVLAKFLVTGPNAKCPAYKFRLHFETPEQQMAFLPGDYVILMNRMINESSPEEKLVHCISRKYTPIKVVNQGYMDLVIKIYPNGAMTSYLGKLCVGDKVRMRGSFAGQKVLGPAIPTNPSYKMVLMICAGSGITPMLLLIDYFIKSSVTVVPPKILLLTQNSTVDDIIMEAEINEIMSKHSDYLTVVNYVTSPAACWITGKSGKITPEEIEKINFIPGDTQNYGVFISGPSGFQETFRKHMVDTKQLDPARVFVM
ncbi:hypothetical protein HDV04_004234 [Boothiomyces sp. JEL0838]|nr:hypothetical protein HDV04_004234 [Boothiomyces sp. JEL0838]